ncbi:MAG TPA: PQQ-binding-like beta-propeller repeat protein [Trebonia sp.]
MAAWPRRGPTVTGLLALASLTWALGAVHATAATRASQTAVSSSWTVYHGDADGRGAAAGSAVAVNTTTRAWTSPVLDGEIYGEPLVSSGRVYVATEDDTVYELSAATGAVAWSAHLGSPVPSTDLPCGDITPTVGITGTPVIDQSRGEIFVVADELVNGKPAHMLTGLATASGKVEVTRDVDPAGVDTGALLQRTGLTLDGGQVVFGMGGNDGDCAAYKGRLIAVPETGGTPRMFTVDGAAGESQGAIWMGGAAPVVDSSGDIWVSTGNGSVSSYSHAYDNSDSVLELSPSLKLLQFFAPATWATNNSEDLDMSAAPALLSDGQVILTGKSRIVYLLNGAHLGGIGGQQAALGSACSQDIDGGVAVQGTTAYLPCLSGIIAVRAAKSPAALHLLWSSGTGGGPPIVAAGLVWTIGQNGMLYGLSPATGTVRQQVPIGVPANHFPTPSVADGLLLAPSADQVVAFTTYARASANKPTPAPAPVPASPASSGPTTADNGLPASAIAGLVVAGLVVIGGIGWLVRRRS